MTLARAPSAITDHRLLDAMIEPIDRNDPIESAENAEPIEPTERTEPTLPIDRMEPFEPIDSSESSDQSDHWEAIASVSHDLAHGQRAIPAISVTPTITRQIATTIISTCATSTDACLPGGLSRWHFVQRHDRHCHASTGEY